MDEAMLLRRQVYEMLVGARKDVKELAERDATFSMLLRDRVEEITHTVLVAQRQIDVLHHVCNVSKRVDDAVAATKAGAPITYVINGLDAINLGIDPKDRK